MTDLTGANLSFYWCTLFFRKLYLEGLRHVVISPGSRSTPLTLGAAAFPDLNKHIILDERSAGFTALGIGKATGIPALLICTSGTAAANYYPAVVEAGQSGVPMLLATADRPSRLRNTDANQTIDQLELYGKFACSFKNMGEPDGSEEGLQELQNVAKEYFHQARALPGPVHLNFPFDKPLEPEANYLERCKKKNESFALESGKSNQQKADINKSFNFPDPILKALQKSEKPLILIGQLPADRSIAPVFDLARALRAPVLSEQGSTEDGNALQGFEGFLRNEERVQYLEPDLILRFGLQPASKSLLRALNTWNPAFHIYVTSSSNPIKTALPVSDTVLWDGNDFSTKDLTGSPEVWLEAWKDSEAKYLARKLKNVEALPRLTDGHVYEHLSSQIPTEWPILFSNSFPARDRSMFGSWSAQSVYTNRGASGIDGVTSTALGVCIGTGKPGVLFTGDLAFLHDTNAMLNEKHLKKPLVIVVINNQGGSIFRMLPIADYRPYFTDYFETPQKADLGKLAGSYELPFQRISTFEELYEFNLGDFIEKSIAGKKLLVLEFQTDPDISMELRNKLWGES